jgi:cell division septum initiation protein DivIVA
MALDAEYFDSIYIEVVKKKYYDAGKVQAVFADIREQAEQLHAENDSLRRQLAEFQGRKAELGDALLSAQGIYQEIVERAEQKAAAITARAEEQAAAIQAEAHRKSEQLLARSRGHEENAARQVEEALRRLRQIHQDSMEALDAQWQQFLCSLDPEAENDEATNAVFRQERPEEAPGETVLPPDLEARVGALAEEIFSLEQDETV